MMPTTSSVKQYWVGKKSNVKGFEYNKKRIKLNFFTKQDGTLEDI